MVGRRASWTAAALYVLPFIPAAAAAQGGTELDEIIVTARRTAENIQTVPVSVTAVSSEDLRERSVRTFDDIQSLATGVTLASGNKQNVNVTIRGQSKSLSGVTPPTVVSYFAEVPSPNFGSAIPQFDLSSIQVLKGPQGTLFGRNTTGGALLFSPQAPTDRFEGYIQGGYGNFDNRQISGVLNIPVGDSLRIRLGGDRQVRDGFAKDLSHPERELDNIDDYTLRASVWVSPSEGLTNLTIFDYSSSEAEGEDTTLATVGDGFTLQTILGLQNPFRQVLAEQLARGPRVVDYAYEYYSRAHRFGITNRTEWEVSDSLRFVNIFGYRDFDTDLTINAGVPRAVADGSGAVPAGVPIDLIYSQATLFAKQYSDELQLHGTALGQNLDWQVGAFYLKSKPSGPQGQLVAFAETPLAPRVSKPTYNFIEETSKAVFGHGTYKLDSLLDGLAVEVGLRYTWDSQQSCVGTGAVDIVSVAPQDCLTALSNAAEVGTKSRALTYSAGVNWQMSPDVFLYAVTRRGYRAGGTNGPIFAARLTEFQTFSPERVEDVELGLRSITSIAEGVTFRFNVSGFIGWYSKVQQAVTGVQTAAAACNPLINNPAPISPDGDCNVNNDPSGGTLIVNLGKGRVSGVDLDAQLNLHRVLTLRFGASFLDPQTTRFTAPASIAAYVTDSKIPFNQTADRTFTLGARYELPIDEQVGRVALNLDFYATSKSRYVGAFIPGYTVTNARVEWSNIFDSKVDAAFYARNLFDKDYVIAANTGGAFIGLQTFRWGPPRLYGVEVRYNF